MRIKGAGIFEVFWRENQKLKTGVDTEKKIGASVLRRPYFF